MEPGKAALSRERSIFDSSWLFHRGDIPYPTTWWGWTKAGICNQGGSASELDDSEWRRLDLPHDFVVEGGFSSESSPARRNARGELITGNLGDTSETPFKVWDTGDFLSNRGYLPQAIAWYRKHFEIPKSDEGRRIYIHFDGVFRNSQVFLNDFFVGNHMSGFTGFLYDITDFINYGGENLLAVRVDTSEPEGWYYEGGGIYRHVWLERTAPLHIAPWSFQLFPEYDVATPDRAKVEVQVSLVNNKSASAACSVNCSIMAPDGMELCHSTQPLTVAAWKEGKASFEMELEKPRLWSLEKPELHRCVCSIIEKGVVCDTLEEKFGIRSAVFDAKRGFLLNGRQVKLKGMCCHQDHAGIGSAVPDDIQEFRLRRLKELGCNAYRAAHHAPSPELVDLCDRLGMIMLPENRLASSAPEHVEQLETMVRTMRNHPSIAIWSLWNEEGRVQHGELGARIARTLKKAVRKFDGRPVTAALFANNDKQFSMMLPAAQELDVMGFNYSDRHWQPFRELFPEKPMLITEECSGVRDCRDCLETDEAAGRSSNYNPLKEDTFDFERRWGVVASNDHISGIFIWTGFDHRGEPFPFQWPAVAASSGVLDSCGFPKRNSLYYRSQWSESPYAALSPHWTDPIATGQRLTLFGYTNCEEAELFVNGKSRGRQKASPHKHLEWKGIVYEPGSVELVGFTDGKRLATARQETAGAPYALRLTPSKNSIPATGGAIALDIEVVDRQGRLVPSASNEIRFKVESPSLFLGAGNGDPASHEADKIPVRRAFNGCCQAIIQTKGGGSIKIKVSSPRLGETILEIPLEH